VFVCGTDSLSGFVFALATERTCIAMHRQEMLILFLFAFHSKKVLLHFLHG
jgi:hypothetical protein